MSAQTSELTLGSDGQIVTRIGNRWPELTVLLVGQALGSLAVAVIGIAAPTISQHLHLTGGDLQLVVSGYSLAYTAFLVTGARLGDFGYKRMFLCGVALFTVAGLISGLAPDFKILTAGQILQGAGAALLIPQVLSLIQLRFAGQARSRAVSLYSMTLGFAVGVGLLIGGVLVGTDIAGLTWRPVFLINVPIGVVLFSVGLRWLPGGGGARTSRVHPQDVIMFTAGLALITIGLAFGPSAQWPAWTWAVIAAGLITLTAFAWLETRATTAEPLLDFRALKLPGVRPCLVVVFVVMGGYGTLLYILTAYLQDARHYSVLGSALVFTTYAIGFGLINLIWPRLPGRIRGWVSPAAIAALALAEAALAVVFATRFYLGLVIPLLVIAGAGHGAGFGSLIARVAASIEASYVSAFSGLVNTVFQLSILIGLAALGGYYLSAAKTGGPHGYATALSGVCLFLAIVGAIAVVCALTIVIRLRDAKPATEKGATH
jgi:MFS family permease